MTRRDLLLLLALLSCAPAQAPRPAAPPPPAQLTATSTAQRVVLLSFDGLGADALARWSGGLQPADTIGRAEARPSTAFDRLARDGASARVIPVNPTQTGPAHAAMLTGADPQRNGIVANRFHIPGTPPAEEAHAAMTDPDVESIVEAARRKGKRVGAVPFPSIDGRTPRRTADFGLAWTDPVTRARTQTLTREDFHRDWVPPTWTAPPARRSSFSPIMRARLEWSVPRLARIDIDVVAYDQTNDGVENYDALFLESGGFESAPDAAGWFPVSMRTAEGLHGSWSRLVRFDPKLTEVVIYWGAISRNDAYPSSFRDLLDAEAGFWPGAPDEQADPQTFREQLRRLAEFLTRVQTLTIRRMQFDLLLAYHPAIDEASHRFLGVNDEIVAESFAIADRSLGAIAAVLDPARDALVVTGDHGLVPVDRTVRMNRLLADAGFAPRWRAFASGHVAHLYGGDDADALVNMLTATGHFELVERKGATAHRNSGDVIAYAKPNIALSSSSDAPVVVPRSGGHHGALNTHRELHTVLFAIGAGVPKGSFGEIEQTRVRPLVSSLLGAH